jgi:RNase adapter protein RapZ
MRKQIVVLSGLSGAGKTTAARALEDLGFFVVDNLPPQLIETLITMADSAGGGRLSRIAFVIDAREASFLREFPPTWDRLRKGGQHELMLVFLDCSDEVLVRRFNETRRRHPLDEGDGVLAGIARERALLADISMRADAIIDTRQLSVHALKRLIAERFGVAGHKRQLVTLLSFGFKHGLPQELDMCFDVRFLPNPFFVDELRPLTGNDEPVSSWLVAQPETVPFLEKLDDMIAFLLPRFEQEGKAYVTIAVGCTGGRHRSPTLANLLGQRLRSRGIDARIVHRDIDQPGS